MIYLYILAMALVTYLIRMIPLTVFRKKITSQFICSFLYYVPYACLTAMTIPAVFYATNSLLSALAGVTVAVILAFSRRNLVTVAAGACLAVFIVEQFML
ncbi:MAG: AzlD domain-containing protein [Lachnospiraceae bacterium]|nr:AzlD domain-containing protein [Lachnospiraceae bacterium]